MALCSSDENLSDDEIFFGKLSLKEVKKHILFNNQRQTISCSTENKFSSDDSVSVIETHSEPDIYSVKDTIASPDYSNTNYSLRAPSDWDVKSTDDSFLKLEEMVTEMCMSPKNDKCGELDNTLEVVEFILNNAPLNVNGNNKADVNVSEKESSEPNSSEHIESPNKNGKVTEVKNENMHKHVDKNVEYKTTTHLQIEKLYETPYKTPNSEKYLQNTRNEALSIPSVNTKHAKEIFKTPKNPLSSKKHVIASTKKTPGKSNAYQHITSPVASYIKNCPQVPLLRDIHPKKPLPGSSSIPKFIKNTTDDKIGNKENVSLPSIAYRSAKKTKMITIPDKEKLPQSPWAKKIASSLPKPVVIKHDHREMNSTEKSVLTNQEDSFANLSLRQADLSVCMQKSAVTKLL